MKDYFMQCRKYERIQELTNLRERILVDKESIYDNLNIVWYVMKDCNFDKQYFNEIKYGFKPINKDFFIECLDLNIKKRTYSKKDISLFKHDISEKIKRGFY